MEWFTDIGWLLPNWAWLVIAAVVLALIIIIIAVAVNKSGKKSSSDAAVDGEKQVRGEQKSAPETSAEKEEGVTEKEESGTDKEEGGPEDVQEKPAAPQTKSSEKSESSKKTNKVYHISKRKDDGKWQVKAAGGTKAVKLFKTQAEAIDYAKTLAGNQDARIVIHKADGSFRTLNYRK